MAGRSDYQERKQRRIENYQAKSAKHELEAKDREKKANKILRAIDGQPLLIGHYSEKKHRADLKRMDHNFRKAYELQEKSSYYEYKAKAAQKNSSISSDDPEAIQKLENELERLEKTRELTKKTEHTTYELNYISADIRRVKARIKELKELEQIKFKEIILKNGTIIHNKEKNRIQILFNDIPDEEIRAKLKHNGFKWARNDKAWQRLFNTNAIRVVKRMIKDNVLEVADNEKVS